MLSVLGVYQEGIAKSTVNEKPVHAHLYEVCKKLYTTLYTYTYIYINILFISTHLNYH